jgi:hypothetical protein
MKFLHTNCTNRKILEAEEHNSPEAANTQEKDNALKKTDNRYS